MTIFKASKGGNTLKSHGTRLSYDPAGFFDFESEVLQNDEYAWSWGVAHAFVKAFCEKFKKVIELRAEYEKNLLGSCRHYTEANFCIQLRPTLRGNEAWRTLFHELAHSITSSGVKDSHGSEWRQNLIVVHDFWASFLNSLIGEMKTRLIEMVTNYGYWRGRPIGLDENTDPWNRPWVQNRGR